MDNPITLANLFAVASAMGAVWLIGAGIAFVGLVAQERARVARHD